VPVKGVSELQEESRGYRPATLGRALGRAVSVVNQGGTAG